MILNVQQLIIIEMSRGLFSAISAVTLVTGTALYYLWKSNSHQDQPIVDRLVIKKTLIKLRKRAYSTLRQIAFIVNHIRTLEGDLEVKKISQIFMRDGGSGEKKLQAIEALVLQESNISQKAFQQSTNYYCQCDIQIKLLLELFRKDLSMALQGVIESYHGPLPKFTPEKVLKIEEQIVKRRMSIICKKYIERVSNEECLALEGQIQEYLLEEGISHEKEPNEKLFMSMLEHYYRHDYEFKEKFERLEMDLQLFMIEIQNKHNSNTPEDPPEKFTFNKKKNRRELENEKVIQEEQLEEHQQRTGMRQEERMQY